jgi:hypothetical protein
MHHTRKLCIHLTERCARSISRDLFAANATPGPKPNPIPQGLGEISSEMDYQSFGQARDDQHSSGEALRGPASVFTD